MLPVIAIVPIGYSTGRTSGGFEYWIDGICHAGIALPMSIAMIMNVSNIARPEIIQHTLKF